MPNGDLLLTLNDPNTATGGQFSHGFLNLPGVAGYYASAPDSVALSVTGDLDLRLDCLLVDWTPSSTVRLVCKRLAGVNYDFYLDTDGKLAFFDGADTFKSSVALSVTDGQRLSCRCAVDVDDGGGTRTVRFYTATDFATWSLVGTAVTGGTAGALSDTADILTIGVYGDGSSAPLNGRVYRVQVLNGIGGTVAFDADFTAQVAGTVTFTESSSNAATVTVHGVIAADGSGNVRDGRAVGGVTFGGVGKVGHAATFDGVNDYVRVLNWGGAVSPITIAAWIKPAAIGGSQVIASNSDAADGFLFFLNAAGKLDGRIRGGTGGAILGGTVLTAGVWTHVALVCSGSTVALYVNGVSDATPVAVSGAVAGTGDCMVGAQDSTSPNAFFGGMLDDVRVYASALTANQVLGLATTRRFPSHLSVGLSLGL